MVQIEHRAVFSLSHYWHAGFKNAKPGTFLKSGTALRLYKAAESLPDGFGLAVFDAWRPLSLQRELYELYVVTMGFSDDDISPPDSNPSTPPPHLTGGAVDLTLSWMGSPLALGTGFDDFSLASSALSFEHTPGLVRDLRRLLFKVMSDAGFVGLQSEWWHFEYGTPRWSGVCKKPPLYGPADVVASDYSKFTNSLRAINIH